ncbi:hypothetical protein GCM10025767_22550 [Thalassotalea piscium]|uniref:Uncharacterized protein n=1 Tax=Thalassotalea piscium TaxID=1230533 RepID=A0A7X0TS58_9GAMM|nr:hypothetical protein [Thalassotalea piscium]
MGAKIVASVYLAYPELRLLTAINLTFISHYSDMNNGLALYQLAIPLITVLLPINTAKIK